jgi:hypothetical protein
MIIDRIVTLQDLQDVYSAYVDVIGISPVRRIITEKKIKPWVLGNKNGYIIESLAAEIKNYTYNDQKILETFLRARIVIGATSVLDTIFESHTKPKYR